MNVGRWSIVALGMGGLAAAVGAQPELAPWPVEPQSAPQRWAPQRTYEFGDYTSQTLTTKAWQALAHEDAQAVSVYTKMCITLYEAEAKRQQASLNDFASKDQVFQYWALNDVATCYFILGESLRAHHRPTEAKAVFTHIVTHFRFAQCWDPKGWFWRVADGARVRLTVLP